MFHFRIECEAIREILLPRFESGRLIGNIAAFNDALSAGSRATGSHLVELRGRWRVIFQIPICCAESLPDSAEIGVTIGGARAAIGSSTLRSKRCHEAAGADCKGRCKYDKSSLLHAKAGCCLMFVAA
jgi:hypothetical protein